MFENLIGQPAAGLLAEDIASKRLPPSILFSGPSASGKLTCAIELARVLSCEKGGSWTCTCASCLRHKELAHPDLLIAGPKDSILEIRAASAAFIANRTPATRYLFLRSVRKLSLRFHPSLTDRDDAKFAKAVPLLADLEERLEELSPSRPLPEDGAELEKSVKGVVGIAEKLESDCLWDSMPVAQVRNAAAWSRLSPSGRTKVLVVEGADRMQESARNAFLKVLEEPPANAVFILTTSRRGAIMPTILSRVRTYAFIERDSNSVAEVVSRVFRADPAGIDNLTNFFYRFLPVPPDAITAAAALFVDLVLKQSIDSGRRPLPGLRGAVSTVLSESDAGAELGIPQIVSMLNKCKPGIVWHLFLSSVAGFMRKALASGGADARETAIFARWTVSIRKALDSVDIYNINPVSALEMLSLEMREAC